MGGYPGLHRASLPMGRGGPHAAVALFENTEDMTKGEKRDKVRRNQRKMVVKGRKVFAMVRMQYVRAHI